MKFSVACCWPRNFRLILLPSLFLMVLLLIVHSSSARTDKCPDEHKYGPGPPADCPGPVDPNKKSASGLEKWFSREMFSDLFPYANLGWGPHRCWPYSYDSFVIAARYFPRFGTESPLGNGLDARENSRRDVAAFLAHAIQETGLNDISLYQRSGANKHSEADDCFYRGGLFNWFEGGPISAFLEPSSPGYKPADGDKCLQSGRYCSPSLFFQCGNGTHGDFFESCYFGRDAIQISYNYNYGQFADWLQSQNISVDLQKEPNLVLTKMDPPLALMASLWFYMTPQPPKPAMHDLVLGQWHPGKENEAAGYSGPIFGPTSLVINNECTGEDPVPPGSGGENRRIRAFKWFCNHFGVPVGNETMLSCKKMAQRFDQIPQNVSWEPDWASTWRDDKPCQCAPAAYGGPVPYFQPGFYPDHFVQQNEANRKKCQQMLNENPAAFGLDSSSSGCLNFTANGTGNAENKSKGDATMSRTSTPIPTSTGQNLSNKEKNSNNEDLQLGQLWKRVAATIGKGTTNYLRPNLAAIIG